ncbi:hypothetical protein AVL59_28460 [Streptomyces griseochromogenes]|nr:hypothetical protein AVL59_28460 [Streptomyces griseochromogenes]
MSQDREEELLLARVSEAAGRARLGRRRATYRAPATVPGVRRRRRSGGGKGTSAGARLDFYEHGVTVALDGRIHVIRYDTTVVRRRRVLSTRGITRACVLTDIDGEWIVLRGGAFGHPQVWVPEIRRAVTEAQVPRALAALARGARLTFGPVWITKDGIGSGRVSLRWPQIERIEIRNGSAAVRVGGRWEVWGSLASGIPNPFVFHALAEHLAGRARTDMPDD